MLKRVKYLKTRASYWVSKKIVPAGQVVIRQVDINGY